MPIIKAINQLIISIPLCLTPFQPPTIWKYCQIFPKKKKTPKAHTFSAVDRISSLSYIGKLTTFQQLDFTNGKTASVFPQLHIWLSLLLHGAEAGSPREHSPLEPHGPLGPASTARLRGTPSPQALGSSYFISICKASFPTSTCGEKCSNVYLGLLRLSVWCGNFSISILRHDCSRTLENV